MWDSREVKFALDAVRRAAQLARDVQREMVSPALTKSDRSPVTVADFAAQALVGRLLAEEFPDDVLVAEEDADALRDPAQRTTLKQVTKYVDRAVGGATTKEICDWIDRGGASPQGSFWTLDPIDGTKGFLRREQYAVALARIVAGKAELGILGCPNLRDGYIEDVGGPGSLIVAMRGQGAWTLPIDGGSDSGEPRRLAVSDRDDPAEARLLRSVESGHTNVGQINEVVATLGTMASPVLMDSQAKYGVLAAGGADLLLRLISPDSPDYRENIWDQAAGSLVVEEAGGRITDLDGKPLDFSQGRTLAANRGVVASNGRLHEAALAALRTVGA